MHLSVTTPFSQEMAVEIKRVVHQSGQNTIRPNHDNHSFTFIIMNLNFH